MGRERKSADYKDHAVDNVQKASEELKPLVDQIRMCLEVLLDIRDKTDDIMNKQRGITKI